MIIELIEIRFSTRRRTYKYFFLKSNLNIDLMKESATHLLGEHDFRNFCKIDTVNVDNFKRTIHSFTIDPYNKSEEVFVMNITGNAFLWHQVRCMTAVLFLVGQGLEKPSVRFSYGFF